MAVKFPSVSFTRDSLGGTLRDWRLALVHFGTRIHEFWGASTLEAHPALSAAPFSPSATTQTPGQAPFLTIVINVRGHNHLEDSPCHDTTYSDDIAKSSRRVANALSGSQSSPAIMAPSRSRLSGNDTDASMQDAPEPSPRPAYEMVSPLSKICTCVTYFSGPPSTYTKPKMGCLTCSSS